jgi:hypothetical protein
MRDKPARVARRAGSLLGLPSGAALQGTWPGTPPIGGGQCGPPGLLSGADTLLRGAPLGCRDSGRASCPAEDVDASRDSGLLPWALLPLPAGSAGGAGA